MIVLDTNVVSELVRPVPSAPDATRNVNDHEDCAIKVLNPWDAR